MRSFFAFANLCVFLSLLLVTGRSHAQDNVEGTALWQYAADNWNTIRPNRTYDVFESPNLAKETGLGCAGAIFEAERPSDNHDILIRYLAPHKLFYNFQAELATSEKNIASPFSGFATSKKNANGVTLYQHYSVIRAEKIKDLSMVFKFCFDLREVGAGAQIRRSDVMLYDLQIIFVPAARKVDGSVDLSKVTNETWGRKAEPSSTPPITITGVEVRPKAAETPKPKDTQAPQRAETARELNAALPTFAEVLSGLPEMKAGENYSTYKHQTYGSSGALACSGFTFKINRSSKKQDFAVRFQSTSTALRTVGIVTTKDQGFSGARALPRETSENKDQWGARLYTHRLTIPAEELNTGDILVLKLCYSRAELAKNFAQQGIVDNLHYILDSIEREPSGLMSTNEDIVKALE